MLISLIPLIVHVIVSPSQSWTRGSFTTLTVASSPLTYSVKTNGSAWLSGGGVAAQCGGVERSTFNSTLLETGATTFCGGVDARLGAFDCVAQALVARYGDARCALTVSFRYYTLHDAFEFSAVFPAAGVAGTATAAQPNAGGGWPQGPWPLSTAFPAFANASPRLGFLNTHGNLLSDNFVWAPSNFLAAYSGGMEGGPLLLFDASASAAHPPALVLSPLTNAKSVFVAPWAVQPPPLPHLMDGVYHEVTHGKMAPIFCTTAQSASGAVVATFANADPRRDSCWVIANCSLETPLKCVNGTYWASDGSPFGPPWYATVEPDFSRLITSDGAVWVRNGVVSGVAVGVSGLVTELPPNFTQRALLVGRSGGVSAAWAGWGAAMTAGLTPGRFSLEDDVYNSHIHYMSDNGAIYCYCNDVTRMPMRNTLASLISYHRSIGVMPRLYHLDPFWHSHHLEDGHCDGVTASAWNESEFHWQPSQHGGGLAALGVDTQMLFMLLAGPRKVTDRPGGNVYDGAWPMQASDTDVLTGGSYDGIGGNSQVAASHSRRFWDFVLGERVRNSRLRALVTDTLFVWLQGFSSRLNNTLDQEQWLDGLFGAASALGLPVRVDQSNPSDHLASAHFGWSAFVSARCGLDQDSGDTWSQMATTGAFLAALQIRPVMDVLWTTSMQPTRNGGNRPHIAHELIIATLTTGPVGIGDAENFTNTTLLRQATRADDVILKPAAAAARLDALWSGTGLWPGDIWAAASVPARSASARLDRRADSRAVLAGASGTTGDGVWWWTLLATQVDSPPLAVTPNLLWPPSEPNTEFVAVEFGVRCANGSLASSCLVGFGTLNVSTQVDASGTAPRLWRLWSVAPVLVGGWVLVGEEAKFVRMSPQRIVAAASVTPAPGASDALNALELCTDGSGLAFNVLGAPSEVVRLTLVAPPARGSPATAAAALAGTVVVLDVVVGVSGTARVRCRVSDAPSCTQ